MSEPTPHQDTYADEDVVGHGPPKLADDEGAAWELANPPLPGDAD